MSSESGSGTAWELEQWQGQAVIPKHSVLELLITVREAACRRACQQKRCAPAESCSPKARSCWLLAHASIQKRTCSGRAPADLHNKQLIACHTHHTGCRHEVKVKPRYAVRVSC